MLHDIVSYSTNNAIGVEGIAALDAVSRSSSATTFAAASLYKMSAKLGRTAKVTRQVTNVPI